MDEPIKKTEPEKLREAQLNAYKNADGTVNEDEARFAASTIEGMNDALNTREQKSIVFNGVPYSTAYEYNQKKGINYSQPKNTEDDREVSLGMVHEKIISFCAIFLKYVFKRRIKCYDQNGNLVKGMGEIYELGIAFSLKMEEFAKKIALIYWEVFTQGNAFVLEDWEVKTITDRDAFDAKGKKIDKDNMDYTYEFLDGLTFKDAESKHQTRRAVSRVLDGRNVIFANPEIEEVQEQPFIVIEEELDRATAEKIYGTLKRWKSVPKQREEVTALIGDKSTLFDNSRLANPDKKVIIHRIMNKENNRFNLFVNGIMMLHRDTPFRLFYPRGNYPLTNIPAERLRGSIYSRSIPAKTKFTADFVDWALKNLALKFEQGVNPAILAKGRYTITRDIFRAGQVTHGIQKDNYEKADPDNKGVTTAEFSFFNTLKEILEAQTVNPTTSGELSGDATATEIGITENNQRDKLGFLLDGIVGGFMDMALRRAETIEAKYTIKQKETVVDGKTIPVYQNFTVNVAGIEHSVEFDDEVGGEAYDFESKRGELHKKAYAEKKAGFPSEYYLANPKWLRENKYTIDIEIHPERIKDSQLQMMQMWDEFTQLLNVFQQDVNKDEMKKIYAETSGRSGEIFISRDMDRLNELINSQAMAGDGTQAYNKGSMGKPMSAQKATFKQAMK
jgi:hypothetical protein